MYFLTLEVLIENIIWLLNGTLENFNLPRNPIVYTILNLLCQRYKNYYMFF